MLEHRPYINTVFIRIGKWSKDREGKHSQLISELSDTESHERCAWELAEYVLNTHTNAFRF